MDRATLLEQLADLIVSVEKSHPVRVAIDGVDAIGKTTLADELVGHVEQRGRPVVRASIDGYHRPRAERYQRGQDSAEGYYYDSFDYDSLKDELLEQLGPSGSMRYRPAVFDVWSDAFLYQRFQTAPTNAILLFDGIFLLRPELNEFWELRIFLQAEFAVTIERAVHRALERDGTIQGVRESYMRRYVPGQTIYLETVRPQTLADVVVDNNDLSTPSLHMVNHPTT